MLNLFIRHPKKVGETYWEHARFALRFSWGCLQCAFFSGVHAIFPFLFETRAGDQICRLAALCRKGQRARLSSIRR